MKADVQRDFLGKPVNLRISYKFHKAIPGDRLNKPEDAFVEIISITTQDFAPAWTTGRGWVEVQASEIEVEDIAEEILNEYL